jgi:ABC-type lipoprotein release transport system permease subunit
MGVLILWVAGLLATLAPAVRASRISPAIATRNV